MQTDKAWQRWGQREPYYAVLTDDQFLRQSGPDLDAFFASGEHHLDDVWRKLEGLEAETLRPRIALDFGCGAGRVLVPLTARCEHAIGVDVAPSMLGLARENLEQRAAISHWSLLTTQQWLAAPEQRYDLLHSHIVLQHIRPRTGLALLDEMLRRLEPGGYAALELHYRWDAPAWRRGLTALKNRLPGAHRLLRWLKRDAHLVAPMEMNAYPMNRVLRLLAQHGLNEPSLRLGAEDGLHNVTIYARKRPT